MAQHSYRSLALAVAIAACLPGNSAFAQTSAQRETVVNFDIPAGDLSFALERFSTQSGIQAMYRQDLVRGKRSSAIKGAMTASEGLAKLLNGSGLGSERVNAKTYVLKAGPQVKARQSRSTTKIEAPSVSTEATGPEVQNLDTMVVVGSRLGTSPVESAMPIKIITREQIDRSGASSIAQALSSLPEIPLNSLGDREIGVSTGFGDGGNTNSTTVQMRGLPRGTTLILINGRRAGDSATFSDTGQFDLSTIPLSLVDRIEVLPAGSSAVYGGDGLAGVINVVLKKDASGFELRTRKSLADGLSSEQANLMWGKSWARGNLTVAASWNKNDELFSQERAITADQDFTRFGGKDLRSSSSNPGSVYSLVGCPTGQPFCGVPLSQRGFLPGLTSTVATVPSGQNGVDLTPGDFAATQGAINKSSFLRHLRSAEEAYGIVASGRVQLTPSLEGFTELAFTKRNVPAYQVPFGMSFGQYGVPSAVVAADNPFNPFGVPVGVDYYYRDTGIYGNYHQEHYRALAGFSGKTGKFSWEVSTMQARDTTRSYGSTFLDQEAMANALSSTDPTTALNPFVGDGGPPASREVLLSLFGDDLNQRMKTRTDVLTAFVRGPIVKLPAGNVLGLIGLERQRSAVSLDSNDLFLLDPQIEGASHSRAVFAEVRVPLVAPRDGSSYERLAVTGAMRSESSERFSERTQTETIGLEFRPSDSLLLRSTYSTAFRPLLTYNAAQSPLETQQWISDPLNNPDQWYPVNTFFTGGIPEDLGPEKSVTTTFGFLYRPTNGISFSLTHWDMKFRDRISHVAVETLINNEAYFAQRVQRDPVTGLITFIDARQINIARNDTAGVDLALDTEWDSRIGAFSASLAATYAYKYEQQLTDTSPTTSNVAVHNRDGWSPRWKIVPRFEWSPKAWLDTALVGRYVSRYRDSTVLSSGSSAGEFLSLGDMWVFDINVNISLDRFLPSGSLLSQSKLNLGATNLFNKLPEFCAGCGFAGYDASQYDVVGRTIYAELRFQL